MAIGFFTAKQMRRSGNREPSFCRLDLFYSFVFFAFDSVPLSSSLLRDRQSLVSVGYKSTRIFLICR